MSKKGSVHVSVDVECDGPIIGRHSCISFGAVIVETGLVRTFYREIKPIWPDYVPDALAVSGFTRSETMTFGDPKLAMLDFDNWLMLNIKGKPILWADNNGFDASWINWYFHTYIDRNPFGWSSRRIGDVYCGMTKNVRDKWKHLRKTKHEHNALGDAMGNAEALLAMQELGLKMK